VDWQVQVDNKRVHMMEFNKSMNNPMIINGWSDLRTIYNFEGYKKNFFVYVGDNFFKIAFDEKEPSPNVFPPFHSLSTAPKFHISFRVTLQRHASLYKPLVMILFFLSLI
jgi:hypothetical protein